jgi:hypothetical protein
MSLRGYAARTGGALGPALYETPFYKSDLKGLYKHIDKLSFNLTKKRWNTDAALTVFNKYFTEEISVCISKALYLLKKYSVYDSSYYPTFYDPTELHPEDELFVLHLHHIYVYCWLSNNEEFKYFLDLYVYFLKRDDLYRYDICIEMYDEDRLEYRRADRYELALKIITPYLTGRTIP